MSIPHAPTCANDNQSLICQRASLIDSKEHSPPIIAIPASPPTHTSPELQKAFRFSQRYCPMFEDYSCELVRRVRAHFIQPPNPNPAGELVNIAIDCTGKLLWITVDQSIGTEGTNKYADALVTAIAQSAPFPPFPKGAPARIIFRIPFDGPSAEALQPELMECNKKPSKTAWECSADSAAHHDMLQQRHTTGLSRTEGH